MKTETSQPMPLPSRDPARPFAGVLLATDLDGTFLGPQGCLLERNLEAVARFKAGGGYFTAATGRIHHDMLRIIPDASTLFNVPAILANGAYLYDFATETVLSESLMDPDSVCRFVHFIADLDPRVGVRISTSDGFLADSDHLNPYVERDMNGCRRRTHAMMLPMSQWPLDRLRLYKMVVRGEPALLAAVRPVIEQEFQGIFSFTTSDPCFLELQTAGCDKGAGLLALTARLRTEGRGPTCTVAAGNHENDLPMLRVADVAGCPCDALESVKPFCRYILCPYAEGCVSDLIERLEYLPFA